ncbi:MAG TPA: ABC transporter permease [Burkholderiaceae bacterium]|jgi:sodium transport system permease protein
MMKLISTMFWKDLLESLRDRRTVIRMILMPCLVIPLMGHFFMLFTQNNSEKLDKSTLDYAIVGENNLPELAKLYAADSGFHRVDVAADKLSEAIRNKTIRFALVIPEQAKQSLAASQGVDVKFMYYQSAPSHGIVKVRGTAPLTEFSEKQRDWRLAFMGVNGETARSTLLNPVTVSVDNVASEREQIGHSFGTLLAYPLIVICFMGCAFSAVELATGEKVKGTLEILIMLPISRTLIIISKYLVVFSLGMMYSTLCMGSLVAWLFFEGANSSEAVSNIVQQAGMSDLFLVWFMFVPVNALFAAILLAISVYAKSYREASGMSGAVNVVIFLAITAIFAPGVNLTWMWASVPVANIGLVIRELVKGTLHDYVMLGYILSTTAVIASVALSLSISWFRKESVIFRE